jgi:hypothetical protein
MSMVDGAKLWSVIELDAPRSSGNGSDNSVRWMSTIRAAMFGSVARAAGLWEPDRGLDRGRLLAPPFGEAKGGR